MARACVYAIIEVVDSKAVKLGKSAGHPSQRLRELQTGNPRPLRLLAYTRHLTERAVHLRWRALREQGEWFRLDRGLLSELRTWDWLDELLHRTLTETLYRPRGLVE
jgi:hypothetical protein